MHVLVLGGNGFIGSHFVRAAVFAGHKVSVLSRKNQPAYAHGVPFRHLMGGFDELISHPEWLEGVEAVCHCAWSSVPLTAAADPVKDIHVNLIGTVKLLELLKDSSSLKQLLFLSSGGAVYGAVGSSQAIKESMDLDPIGAYGIGKLAAEKYCSVFSVESGIPVTIIRPANPYGIGQASTGLLGVISTFLNHALHGTEARVYGDGSIVRDFVDVRDLAELMVMALDRPAAGIYNCGSGSGASLTDIITTVERITERNLILKRLPARSFDPPRIVLDVNKARDAFDWTPKVSLYQGISDLWGEVSDLNESLSSNFELTQRD